MTEGRRRRRGHDAGERRRRGFVPNIGSDGRRRRFGLAAIGFALVAALLTTLAAAAAGPAWRAAALPLFWIGFLGLFQAAGRT